MLIRCNGGWVVYRFPFCAIVPRALPLAQAWRKAFTPPKSDFVAMENEIMTLLLAEWCETMAI